MDMDNYTFNYQPQGRIVTERDRYFELERQRQERERRIRLDQEQQYRDEIHARQEEQRKEKFAAEARAKMLLLAHLNDEQRKTYEEKQFFDVVSSNGRTWRIRTDIGASGNVIYMDGEQRVASYCCYVRDYNIPITDHYLAQKIVLEQNENYWLEIAVIMDRFNRYASNSIPLPTPIYDTKEKKEAHTRRRVMGLLRVF